MSRLSLVPRAVVSGLALVALVCTGCRADRAAIEDRLWVSAVPDGPRGEFSALFVTGGDTHRAGVVHRGPVYEGSHRAFSWKRERGAVTLEFLQSGRRHQMKVDPCDPVEGFDACLRLRNDPTGVERWYSRKRWIVPRRGRADLSALLAELAPEDPQLAAIAGPFTDSDAASGAR